MFYTYSQYLITLNIVVTSLSLLSSFTMSFLCFKSPMRHTVCLKLILGIALADFFYSISNVFSFFDNSTEAICVIESILRLCSYQFSLIFATSIAILCYKTSTPHLIFDQRGFFKAIIALCCTSLAILILLPLIFPEKISFAHQGMLCMITYSPDNKTKAGKLLVLTLYQGIISIAGILITFCCYIRTVKRLRRLAGEIDGLLDVNLKRLFWYPAVMSVIYIPSLMDNYWAIYTNMSPDWLIILHFGLTHLVGFFNFVVYGWQRKFYYNRDRRVGKQSDQQVEVHTPQEGDSASISLDEELLQKKRLK